MSQAILSALKATAVLPFSATAVTAFSSSASSDVSPPAPSVAGVQQEWRFVAINAINGDLLVNWGPAAGTVIDPTEGHARVWNGTTYLIAVPPGVKVLVRGSGGAVNGSVQYYR